MVDIKATLSRVLQDPTVKEEELRARAKGLRTLGRIFQKEKSASETESEPILHFGVHNLNGVDQDHSSRGVEAKQSSQTTMAPKVLQDPTVKKEELRTRAKGLRTLGRIFQVFLSVLYLEMSYKAI
ncbi:DnaJ heat shock N-terminal domain-containing protein [Tanacetum coccineum]